MSDRNHDSPLKSLIVWIRRVWRRIKQFFRPTIGVAKGRKSSPIGGMTETGS